MPDATAEAVMKRLENMLEERLGVDPDVRLRASHDVESWTGDQQGEGSAPRRHGRRG